MTIVERLKALVEMNGGSSSGIRTIEQGIKALEVLTNKKLAEKPAKRKNKEVQDSPES